MTIGKPEFDALLKEISSIAIALKNPRSRALSSEPPLGEPASRNLDYQVLRELMGRLPATATDTVVFPVGRIKVRGSNHPTLRVDAVPSGAVELAVFTGPGVEAEVVDLSKHAPTYVHVWKLGPHMPPPKPQPTDYRLTTVTNDQEITRLEFRRADHYPIALGPRLPVV